MKKSKLERLVEFTLIKYGFTLEEIHAFQSEYNLWETKESSFQMRESHIKGIDDSKCDYSLKEHIEHPINLGELKKRWNKQSQ